MKYCIFTYIFDDYDIIREPLYIEDSCDYFLFTDNKQLYSEKWNIIYLKQFDTNKLSGIQKSNIFKYTFNKYIPNICEYDYIVKIDSSMQLYKSLNPIIEYLRFNNKDLSIAPHPLRDNFIDEYLVWINNRYLDTLYLKQFISLTKDYEYNMSGLCETGLMIIKNSEICWKLIEDIHNILSYNDNKDHLEQCYFSYILYKYINKLNINWHASTLYRYSDYIKLMCHGNNYFEHNESIKQNKNLIIFNKNIEIIFPEEY